MDATRSISHLSKTLAARASTSSGPPSDASLSALFSTLVPTLIIAGIFFVLFLVFRRIYLRQYQARTYLTTIREEDRSPKLPNGLFNWFGTYNKIPDSFVLNHESIDGFLLLRFLKISVVICAVGSLLGFIILWPVYATGGGSELNLAKIAMGNLAGQNNPRLYATLFVAWAFYGFVWFVIARETVYYVNLRQAYLISPLYANRISSRTVLFTSVPAEFLEPANIKRLFGKALKNFWIAGDTKELQKLVTEREKAAYKLEGAETKLIKLAAKARQKAQKKGSASQEEENIATEGADINGESGSVASRWVEPKQRPTHRLKPLIGKKVDTINWARAEIQRLDPEIKALQAKHRAGETSKAGSLFVEFYTQSEAQAAFQTTTHHQALHMAPRFVGVNPEEVIWSNLRIKWWERKVRYAAVIAFVAVLIIFWAIPVAFVGLISNIDELRKNTPWLQWMYQIPPAIFGIISGLLPSVLLAVLMALLPVILRLAAKLGGAPSVSAVELSLQNFYYTFQVVQVFLVATLGGAASSLISDVSANPSSAASVLANKLPKASNIYVTYFITQGLTVATGQLLQIVGLLLFKLLGKFLDNTPRKVYKRWINLSAIGWGTVYPVYTLVIAVSIIYATIAPLVLGFGGVCLYLFYVAQRYNFIFVYGSKIDCKGLGYPKALNHLTVGIYIGEVCLIGLFGINEAAGPAVLMVIFLIFSILFHIGLRNAYAPLLATLPKSLDLEEEYLLTQEKEVVSSPTNGTNGANGTNGTNNPDYDIKDGTDVPTRTALPAPHKQPSLFAKFFRPDIYCDYQTLRRLVVHDHSHITYSEEVERDAFHDPSVSADTPLLWIPRDTMGISRQEVAHTAKITPITDEGATIDENGKIQWDPETRPPIYEDKIYW